MINNNNKTHTTMLHPQQPISRRWFWGFVVGIEHRKLATSCWNCHGSYSSTHIKQCGYSYNT